MKFFVVFAALASVIFFVSAEAPLPSSQYGTPAPAISVQYGAPQPAPQYGAPAPAPQYGAPAPQYGAPAPAPQYGAPPSTEYGAPAGGKIRKFVSVHVGGNDDVSDQVQTIRAGGPPDTNYNIIFVKAPSSSSNQQTEVILPEQNHQKTVVYVLVKKPDSSSNIRVRGPAPTSPSKPDVYFIRYKNEQPSGAYGAPAPAYGAPAPAPTYGAPAPAPQYGAPAPAPQYGAPAPAPSATYEAVPSSSYGTPS